MRVATGSRSAGIESSPTRVSPSAVCSSIWERRAGRIEFARMSVTPHSPPPALSARKRTAQGRLRHNGALRRALSYRCGRRRSRAFQQAVCQCLRSARSPRSSAGHATTCATPAPISWSHPGQRYVLTPRHRDVAHRPLRRRVWTRCARPRAVPCPRPSRSSLSLRWFLRGTRAALPGKITLGVVAEAAAHLAAEVTRR